VYLKNNHNENISNGISIRYAIIILLFLVYYSDNVLITDAHHEAHLKAKRRFAHYKIYQAKLITAGVHSYA
jgi:hypothetical protein